MPVKFKQSIKETIKDANGRPTNMWKWKHFYLKEAKTEDIIKEIKDGKKKHRNKQMNELNRRGVKLDG